mmetsp:Transcript_30378/g.75470  ORF Transcript_30378/g.75470 Transcript_30378/m.75470 type:complete len:158 (-) Transcript_30378:203-676(-)
MAAACLSAAASACTAQLSSRRVLSKQFQHRGTAVAARSGSNVGVGGGRRGGAMVMASVVTINHEGKEYKVEVDGFDSILEAALAAGIGNLSYDCKMGVCMTCPSRVTAGKVDQGMAMLSDDVAEKGFALLCCAMPVGEGLVIQTVSEDELLEEQLGA